MRKIAGVNTHIFKQPNIPWLDIIFRDYPHHLSTGEKDLLSDMISSQMDSGNWDKFDSLAFMNLADATNSLWDVKRGVSMTAVNNPTHNPGIGRILNGATQSINTNYNPATGGSILDNHFAMSFVESCPEIARDEALFSSENTARTNRSQIAMQSTSTPFMALNSGVNVGNVAGFTKFESNKLYGVSRTNSANYDFLVDGSVLKTQTEVSTSLPDVEYQIGFIKQPSVFFFLGTVSSFASGEAIGFNYADYFSNLIILNTGLSSL